MANTAGSALEDHVHRSQKMGIWVLINEDWYQADLTPVIAPRSGTRRERRPMPHDPIAAKSPFDHNMQALCHHASRKKTASASKTLLKP